MNELQLHERVSRVEASVSALQRQYDQLQRDVSELRDDVGDLKAQIADVKIEQARHFAEVKDLLHGVTNKALNSLPPWGAIVTMVFGALAGAIAGALLGHVWR